MVKNGDESHGIIRKKSPTQQIQVVPTPHDGLFFLIE